MKQLRLYQRNISILLVVSMLCCFFAGDSAYGYGDIGSDYNVDALRAEVATASDQFRNADMVEAGEDLVYDMAGNWGKTVYGHLVEGTIGSIKNHARTYYNALFARGTKTATERLRLATARGSNGLKAASRGGKAISGLFGLAQAVRDVTVYNAPSKHEHSSLALVELSLRGFSIISSTMDALGNKTAKPLALGSGYLKDAWGSEAFSEWMNSMDNVVVLEVLGFTNAMTDAFNWISLEGWKVLFTLTRQYGYGDPKTLPALRTALKPNIYLYPEYAQEVLLEFESPRWLTTVIPDYPGEWLVHAQPNGIIRVKEQEYGYLFYESIALESVMQSEYGWSIPAGGHEGKFREILDAYGFNAQEQDDFVEFWCEKLDADCDYTMFPQMTDIVDIAMPLSVSPVPDSVFRLWFTFDPLMTFVQEPLVLPIIRDGFVLVEWGGLILGE